MQDTSKMNVVKIDDKYYVKKIKRATCIRKVNDEYIVSCDIKMRGSQSYTYNPGTDYIIKDTYIKDGVEFKNVLYLEESALNTVINSIDEMNRNVELLNEKGYKTENYIMYYERIASSKYFFLIKFKKENEIIYSYEEQSIYRQNYINEYETREEFINKDAYYSLAEYYNDEILKLELLLSRSMATNEECKRLAELTGRIILHKADIKHNKVYVVESDTVDDVLDQSGYRILHRPYFAMKGSTHDKWELNPYTKCGVDAAKVDAEAITFEEYLEMFK